MLTEIERDLARERQENRVLRLQNEELQRQLNDCRRVVGEQAEEARVLASSVEGLQAEIVRLKREAVQALEQLPFDHKEGGIDHCPTFYDGCHCTVLALSNSLDEAVGLRARVAELELEGATP